jgi:drug/metabolite transporter (DMT)-like permease
MSSRTATLVGLVAIALWALLALLAAASGPMPPFQLTAATFLIGGLAGAFSWLWRPEAARSLRQPGRVWLLGVGGLFGYHALYFAALRLAPPAEAGLVNYLWPLLIVLLSGTLPDERLRPAHVVGAGLGLLGVAVLLMAQGLDAKAEHLPGYACAFAAAFVWAGYSVLSRRFGEVPTDAVAGFCLVTSALSALCHLAFERTVWPEETTQWLALLTLGLGPVGLAFYVWDVGMKRGDICLLGVASYAAPVLSTGLLVLAGYAEPSGTLALSCGLIVTGALVASLMGRAA